MKSMAGEALALAAFRSETRKLWQDINSAWDSVSSGHHVFSQEEDIWPDQCDYVKDSISTLSESVQKFSDLLDNASYLPTGAVPLRFSLIMTLHRVEDRIDELMILLPRFRSLCQTPTTETIKQRRVIERKLNELEQDCEGILPDADRLVLQARTSN